MTLFMKSNTAKFNTTTENQKMTDKFVLSGSSFHIHSLAAVTRGVTSFPKVGGLLVENCWRPPTFSKGPPTLGGPSEKVGGLPRNPQLKISLSKKVAEQKKGHHLYFLGGPSHKKWGALAI